MLLPLLLFFPVLSSTQSNCRCGFLPGTVLDVTTISHTPQQSNVIETYCSWLHLRPLHWQSLAHLLHPRRGITTESPQEEWGRWPAKPSATTVAKQVHPSPVLASCDEHYFWSAKRLSWQPTTIVSYWRTSPRSPMCDRATGYHLGSCGMVLDVRLASLPPAQSNTNTTALLHWCCCCCLLLVVVGCSWLLLIPLRSLLLQLLLQIFLFYNCYYYYNHYYCIVSRVCLPLTQL